MMKFYAALILNFGMSFQSAWAKPPPGCEILMQTSYGRLIQLLAEKKILSLEQLQELARANAPLNPFSKRTKGIDNIAYSQTIEKALRLPETHDRWPATKKAIAVIAGLALQIENTVNDSRIETQNVFKPQLIGKINYSALSAMDILFNTKKAQLVTMNLVAGGTDSTMFNLKSQIPIPGMLKTTAKDMIVRRNGEVWVVAFDGQRYVAHKYPDGETHYRQKEYSHLAAVRIFETPEGRLLLVELSKNKLVVRDITDKENFVEIHRDEAKVFSGTPPVFHVSSNGDAMMAVASAGATNVYRFSRDRLIHLGDVAAVDALRAEILYSDADGNPIVGAGIFGGGYQVVKLVEKQPVKLFEGSALVVNAATAVLQWNSSGHLILAVADKGSGNSLRLINISPPRPVTTEIFIPGRVDVKPTWFSLPNGQEVWVVAIYGEKALVVDGISGGTLTRLNSPGENHVAPIWMKTDDGQIYLAMDGRNRIDIYSVWHPSAQSTNK